MRITSRADPYIEKFVALTTVLGMRNLESMVQRSLYCEIINRPEVPENQIFVLRPAKAMELERFDPRIADIADDQMATALAELKRLAETALPEQIANFRIIPSKESPSKAFLFNAYGEKSATRETGYFRPKTSATLRVHCLSLGGYNWTGKSKMIDPFYDFCLKMVVSGV